MNKISYNQEDYQRSLTNDQSYIINKWIPTQKNKKASAKSFAVLDVASASRFSLLNVDMDRNILNKLDCIMFGTSKTLNQSQCILKFDSFKEID